MGQLVFQATAGGQVALVGPNPSTNFSLNVPAVNGNLVTTGDTGTVTSTMLASSVYTTPGTIGSGTPNSGAFTSLSASSTVSGTGFSTYLASPPAIGGTTAAAGTFTTLTLGGNTKNQQIGQGDASMLKNRIINGAFKIAQRATSSSATGYCCVDRWQFNSLGTSLTWSQQSATVNGIPATVLQIAGASGNTAQNMQQKIESFNSYDLVGQSVTLSFWVYQNTGSTYSQQISLQYPTATDNYTSTTTIATNTVSIPNNSWTYINTTFNSLPSGVSNGLLVQFFANSPALTSGIFQFAFVQLEVGSYATGYEYRMYQQELALCQRYYEQINPGQATAGAASTTVAFLNGSFQVPKRAAPTMAGGSGIQVRIYNGGGVQYQYTGGGVVATNFSNTTGYEVQVSGFTGMTGSFGILYSASSPYSASAEL